MVVILQPSAPCFRFFKLPLHPFVKLFIVKAFQHPFFFFFHFFFYFLSSWLADCNGSNYKPAVRSQGAFTLCAIFQACRIQHQTQLLQMNCDPNCPAFLLECSLLSAAFIIVQIETRCCSTLSAAEPIARISTIDFRHQILRGCQDQTRFHSLRVS